MVQPDIDQLPTFYKRYVERVTGHDLIPALESSLEEFLTIVENAPDDKADFSYGPGKWTFREVLCHMIDVERIMCYRALRFARNDRTTLMGFEEDDYTPESNAAARPVAQTLLELKILRQSTILMFTGFADEMLERSGIANGLELSVKNLGFIIAGHMLHHLQTIREKYLI